MAASSTALNLAAAFFVENEAVDDILLTSDGNVFNVGQQNLAQHHASKLEDTEVYEVARDDSGMAARIVTMGLSAQRTLALTQVVQGVERRAAALAAEAAATAAPTYAEQLAALATALSVSTFTDIPATMTVGSQSITRQQAVIAAWYRSGQTVAEWNADDLEDRVAAVEAAFEDWIE